MACIIKRSRVKTGLKAAILNSCSQELFIAQLFGFIANQHPVSLDEAKRY
jgi:hypothetical protein